MNWDLPEIISAIIIILIFIIYLVYIIKRDGLRNVALKAILEAEKQYNSTTGKERLDFAVNYVYEYLPTYIKIVLPKTILKEWLQRFIQEIFSQVKDLLDYEKGADLIEEK